MPDDLDALGKNHLTKEQQEAVAKHLEATGKKGCPWCGGAKFSIQDMVAPPRYWDGQLHAGLDSAAMVTVICRDCFYVMHFAPDPMGLFAA